MNHQLSIARYRAGPLPLATIMGHYCDYHQLHHHEPPLGPDPWKPRLPPSYPQLGPSVSHKPLSQPASAPVYVESRQRKQLQLWLPSSNLQIFVPHHRSDIFVPLVTMFQAGPAVPAATLRRHAGCRHCRNRSMLVASGTPSGSQETNHSKSTQCGSTR